MCFREFMHESRSSENLGFWFAVEDYKRRKTDDQCDLRVAAQIIVEKYFLDARFSINVDERMKYDVLNKLDSENELTLDLFEEVQSYVYEMMCNDCFRKFLASEHFIKSQQLLPQEGIASQNSRSPAGDVPKQKKKRSLGLAKLVSSSSKKKLKLETGVDHEKQSKDRTFLTESVILLRKYVRNNETERLSAPTQPEDTWETIVAQRRLDFFGNFDLVMLTTHGDIIRGKLGHPVIIHFT